MPWTPILSPTGEWSSQRFALTCPADIVLYTGARGPGKTAAQLMDFRKHVGKFGSSWRGVIIDQSFKGLSDVIVQSKKLYPAAGFGARFTSGSELKWRWRTGEELLFRHARRVEDYDQFHGGEFPWIGYNELTKHRSPEVFDLIQSVNRSADARVPLRTFATTNPFGPGMHWVKERFIDPAKYGEIVTKKVDGVFDVQLQKEVTHEITQCAIFGSFTENPYLSTAYRAKVLDMCRKDKSLYAAWVEGSYEYGGGGALDDLLSETHTVARFRIPSGWYLDRSFDWGSSTPFAVCWWAESNGEDVEIDGASRSFPRGTLFQIAEWYGADGPNIGLKMSPADIAIGIKNREELLRKHGWINGPVRPGPADNQIRDQTRTDTNTIEQAFAEEGVYWTPSNKSAGSRVNGLQLLRDRLYSVIEEPDRPGIYWMENCTDSRRLLRGLPRDKLKPDDIDTNCEDHCFALETSMDVRGNEVWTDAGWQRFAPTRKRLADLVEVQYGDRAVRCTPDHLWFTTDGWCEACELGGRVIITAARDVVSTPATIPHSASEVAKWMSKLFQKPSRNSTARGSTDTSKRRRVLGVVPVKLVRPSGTDEVCCLAVPSTERFCLSGGAIVSNCYDAIRYRVLDQAQRLSGISASWVH